MPKIAFTDVTIQALKPGIYFDVKTPGFGIRIGKTRKTWIVLKGAKSTKLRLGHYPGVRLADARRKALVALGSPYQPASAPAFPEARDAFLAQDRWKPRAHYEQVMVRSRPGRERHVCDGGPVSIQRMTDDLSQQTATSNDSDCPLTTDDAVLCMSGPPSHLALHSRIIVPGVQQGPANARVSFNLVLT
jgi:hypothetical protein